MDKDHLADKLSNLRAIKRDYEEIGSKLWERFNVRDKSEHSWYYTGIIKNIKEAINIWGKRIGLNPYMNQASLLNLAWQLYPKM